MRQSWHMRSHMIEMFSSFIFFYLRIPFIKIRTCNHRLPIETGRWSNIDRNLRMCTMCDRKSIGDEYHYIMECTYFSNERKNIVT